MEKATPVRDRTKVLGHLCPGVMPGWNMVRNVVKKNLFLIVVFLAVASALFIVSGATTAYAVNNPESFVCRNFGVLGANLCAFNSDNSTLSVSVYHTYSGVYPDTSCEFTNSPQTGSFNFTSWNVTFPGGSDPGCTSGTDFWMSFTHSGTDYYYQSNGTVSVNPTVSNVAFINAITPQDQSVSTSTSVYFEGSVIYEGAYGYDEFCFYIDVAFANLVSQIQSDPIRHCVSFSPSSSEQFFNYTRTLSTGTGYIWWVSLEGEGLPGLSSIENTFWVVTRSFQSPLYPANEEEATTTAVSNLSSIVTKMRNIVLSKFPFNWGDAVYSEVNDLVNGTTTQSFDPVAINFSEMDISLWDQLSSTTIKDSINPYTGKKNFDIEFFSTTTIHNVAQTAPFPVARQLGVYMLYLAFGLFVVREIESIFNRNTE